MAFPRDLYEDFLRKILPPSATVYWKGAPEPFFTPIENSPIIVKIDVGTAYGYGTSEVRSEWHPEVQNGDGAYAYFVLQRMIWPLTIDVETFDADNGGEDYLMLVRNKLRWPSNIKRIQDMGITTVRVGDVLSMIRKSADDDRDTFAAVLEISHGQCYAVQTDEDGNVINEIETITGTLTEGRPSPITVVISNVEVP